jgi:hypothetical protein
MNIDINNAKDPTHIPPEIIETSKTTQKSKNANIQGKKPKITNADGVCFSDLPPDDIVTEFLNNTIVQEFITGKISAIRDYISNIVTMNSSFDMTMQLLADDPEDVSEVLKSSVKNNLNGVIRNCYALYRQFTNLTEIMRYFQNKDINLSPTSLNISKTLGNIMNSSNEVLNVSGYHLNYNIEPDLYMFTNKERFENMILALIRLTFQRFPNARQLEVTLLRESDTALALIVRPTDILEGEAISRNDDLDSCERLVTFFCRAFNCQFIQQNSTNPQESSALAVRIFLDQPSSQKINIEFHSTSAALENLAKKDRFSNRYVALSEFSDIPYFK